MALHGTLAEILGPDRVLTRPLDLAAYACDASVYRIVPRAVVRPRDVPDVVALFAAARRERIPLTFRAAGTSLSGQAVGPGVVVDVSRDWRKLEIEDHGRRVRVGPGVVAGFVNRVLAPHRTKLGPDPASIDACRIGGVIANNSSGMCCGVRDNAYHTLDALIFVLPSGTVVDTAARDASARLRGLEPAMWAGLARLRDRVRADDALVAKIRRKYGLKNTMGYAINALVDFDDPLDILWHLLVGSEGTLGFVAEAVFRTVPDPVHKVTGLLFFHDVRAACAAIPALRDAGADALELMDRVSLRSVEGRPGVPPFVAALPPEAAALLIERGSDDPRGLDIALPDLPLLRRTVPTRDPREQAALWTVRKGIIPSVGALRPPGTALITEDVVFPVERLADGVLGLQRLLQRHGYGDSAIYGHAKDGNLHFLLAQRLDASGAARFRGMLDDLAELVAVRFEGALKAEHGTGRNMAPYVALEWGADAYDVMREVKALVDPDGILNPGVLLNDDPDVHVRDLKDSPVTGSALDPCIECGFCEPRCPSRDLTLSPRQRIVVHREHARLLAAGLTDRAAALVREAIHDVEDTCAADGLCALACPVGIDTGAWVKERRAQRHGPVARAAAGVASRHFGVLERGARLALRIHRPWRDLPGPAPPLPRTPGAAAAVYVPSCITRTLAPCGEPLPEVVVRVAARAGIAVTVPEDIEGTCCGLPFASKGFPDESAAVARDFAARLARWTEGGRMPAFTDTSPCAHALRHAPGVALFDGIEFARDVVVPRLAIVRRLGKVAVHPVCSAVQLGLEGALRDVLAACALEVFVPPSSGCCGFAGDRGFEHPELTAAATRAAAAELGDRVFDAHVSTSRTCEIGMTRATGREFRSLWYVLDEVSTP